MVRAMARRRSNHRRPGRRAWSEFWVDRRLLRGRGVAVTLAVRRDCAKGCGLRLAMVDRQRPVRRAHPRYPHGFSGSPYQLAASRIAAKEKAGLLGPVRSGGHTASASGPLAMWCGGPRQTRRNKCGPSLFVQSLLRWAGSNDTPFRVRRLERSMGAGLQRSGGDSRTVGDDPLAAPDGSPPAARPISAAASSGTP